MHFHQLHETCHSRINYVKTCPLHGAVPANEIVSGYEYAKGQYVIVELEELDALKGDKDKSVNVEIIVPSAAIDALYLTERSSYLVPDGRVGEKPYAVIERCLTDQGSVAVGRLVLNGKDEVVMIRPLEGLLVMTILSTAAQVKEPQVFTDEKPNVSISAAELKLTKTLFDTFRQDEIDFSQFKDQYTDRVTELINAKVSGKEIVTAAPSEEPEVINLMEALKKSLAKSDRGGIKKLTAGSATKLARTTRLKTTHKRKSKTA